MNLRAIGDINNSIAVSYQYQLYIDMKIQRHTLGIDVQYRIIRSGKEKKLNSPKPFGMVVKTFSLRTTCSRGLNQKKWREISFQDQLNCARLLALLTQITRWLLCFSFPLLLSGLLSVLSSPLTWFLMLP